MIAILVLEDNSDLNERHNIKYPRFTLTPVHQE